MTAPLGAPPAATRASQTGAPTVPVAGFLAVNGERIESTNLLADRLGTPGLKVVEAYSESWGPCGSVAALMRKFVLEVAPPPGAMQVLVCKAEGNTLLEKFRSTSVPHFLFFRDGHLRDTVVGPNIPQLERALRAHIPKPDDPVVDPTTNRYYKPPPTPSSRPMTAGRPRTADLLRAGRPASRAAPPPMEGLLETTPPPFSTPEEGVEVPQPSITGGALPPGSRPSSAVPRPSASGAPRPSASGAAVPRPSAAGPGLTLDLSAVGDRPPSAAAGSRPSSAVPRASAAAPRPSAAAPRPSAAGGAAPEALAAEGEAAAAEAPAAEPEAAPEAPTGDAPAEPAAAEAPAATEAAPEAAPAPAAEEPAAAAPEAAAAPAAEEAAATEAA